MTLSAVREKKISGTVQTQIGASAKEALVFCPGCKAFDTIWITGTTLMPTRKFIQVNNHIYHDCGSGQPCRLYHV